MTHKISYHAIFTIWIFTFIRGKAIHFFEYNIKQSHFMFLMFFLYHFELGMVCVFVCVCLRASEYKYARVLANGNRTDYRHKKDISVLRKFPRSALNIHSNSILLIPLFQYFFGRFFLSHSVFDSVPSSCVLSLSLSVSISFFLISSSSQQILFCWGVISSIPLVNM